MVGRISVAIEGNKFEVDCKGFDHVSRHFFTCKEMQDIKEALKEFYHHTIICNYLNEDKE